MEPVRGRMALRLLILVLIAVMCRARNLAYCGVFIGISVFLSAPWALHAEKVLYTDVLQDYRLTLWLMD